MEMFTLLPLDNSDKSDLQKVLETQSRKELKTKNYSSRLTAR